jgi:phage-related protein
MIRIFFLADTLDQIRSFPLNARKDIGTELRRVQRGVEPMDWKPMKSVGAGVREIRVRDAAGAFRVLYVLSKADGIYVLNAFQKKTQKTPKHELALAALRLKLV